MNKLVIGGIYKHFKGHVYKIIAVGRDAEDLSEKIIYQNVNNLEDVWIRDKEEFLSEVDREKYPDVTQKFRFQLLENEQD